MAGPRKSQMEIEEKRQRSYAYPRYWPGWGQEEETAPARVQDETPNAAPANAPGNPSATARQNARNTGNHGNRAAAASVWRNTAQQQGAPDSTSGNWRVRHKPPASTECPSNELVIRRDMPITRGEQRAERTFDAMDIIKTGKSLNADIAPETKKRLGFSENYQGDVLNPNNRSDKIKEEDSTSLYFYNLHPSMTLKELLDALIPLGPFGKVQQSNVKPPDPKNGYHYCGAKVAMFHRCEAELLKKTVENREKPVYIKGLKVFVRWNTQKVDDFGKKHAGKMYMSRTLEIQGPKHLVNIQGLYDHFKSKFLFDLQDVVLVYEDDDIRHLRWVFASVLAQSEMAFLSLKERKYNEVEFRYGQDPLDIPQSERARWESQVHLLPALGSFERTNAHPTLPAATAPASLHAPPGRLGDWLENITNNNSDEWDQYEEEIRQNIYDAESDEEADDSNRAHFDHEAEKDQGSNPFA